MAQVNSLVSLLVDGMTITRTSGDRPKLRYYLIVCEGEETEPNYFEGIRGRLPPDMVRRITIDGTGKNTESLVAEATRQAELWKADHAFPVYNAWVVFDRDSFDADDFDNAITSIDGKTIDGTHWHAAWSNEAFELWYTLHFHDATGGAIARAAYQSDLEKSVRTYLHKEDWRYQKNAKDMFEILAPLTGQAIVRARRAYEIQEKQNLPYHEMNPATKVYMLVEELLRYLHVGLQAGRTLSKVEKV